MDLETKLKSGITLKNPLMVASGPLSGSAERIIQTAGYGPGGIVTKTISTSLPPERHPFIFGHQQYLLNDEPWSEFSSDTWMKAFFPEIRKSITIPLIVSIGYSAEDVAELVPEFNEFVDAFELSVQYVSHEEERVLRIIRTVRNLSDKPVYLKLSSHFPDIEQLAGDALSEGASGLVVMNSIGPATKMVSGENKVLFGNEEGDVWMSGPVIKPLTLSLIRRLHRRFPESEIIGVGGIATAEDVVEFLMAGASAVQMVSAALLYGKQRYSEIVKNLPDALKQYGFESVEACRQSVEKPGDPGDMEGIRIDPEKCSRCGLCERVCPFYAMRHCEVDRTRCMRCGLCESRCPRGAISGAFRTAV